MEVTPSAVPFGDGETLTYSAEYIGMRVGEVVTTVEKNATFEGKPAIHLTSATATARAFSTLVIRFRGTGESWIDPSGLYSLGFVTEKDQGGDEDLQEWVLDNERGIALRHRVRSRKGGPEKEGSKEYRLPITHVQDTQSMVYFFRCFPLAVGSRLESNVFESKKVWRLVASVVKRERVSVPAGTYDCLQIRPEIFSLDGQKQDKGQMTVWVTDDERKVPVKIVLETPYGRATTVLTRVKDGKR